MIIELCIESSISLIKNKETNKQNLLPFANWLTVATINRLAKNKLFRNMIIDFDYNFNFARWFQHCIRVRRDKRSFIVALMYTRHFEKLVQCVNVLGGGRICVFTFFQSWFVSTQIKKTKEFCQCLSKQHNLRSCKYIFSLEIRLKPKFTHRFVTCRYGKNPHSESRLVKAIGRPRILPLDRSRVRVRMFNFSVSTDADTVNWIRQRNGYTRAHTPHKNTWRHILRSFGSNDSSNVIAGAMNTQQTAHTPTTQRNAMQPKPECTLLQVSNRPKDARIYINSNNFDTLHEHCRVPRSLVCSLSLFIWLASLLWILLVRRACQSVCCARSRCIFFFLVDCSHQKCGIMCTYVEYRRFVVHMHFPQWIERFVIRCTAAAHTHTMAHTRTRNRYLRARIYMYSERRSLHISNSATIAASFYLFLLVSVLGFVLHIGVFGWWYGDVPAVSCLHREKCPPNYTA